MHNDIRTLFRLLRISSSSESQSLSKVWLIYDFMTLLPGSSGCSKEIACCLHRDWSAGDDCLWRGRRTCHGRGFHRWGLCCSFSWFSAWRLSCVGCHFEFSWPSLHNPLLPPLSSSLCFSLVVLDAWSMTGTCPWIAQFCPLQFREGMGSSSETRSFMSFDGYL